MLSLNVLFTICVKCVWRDRGGKLQIIDDKTGNKICHLITAHMLHMTSATLNDRSQLWFSREYP